MLKVKNVLANNRLSCHFCELLEAFTEELIIKADFSKLEEIRKKWLECDEPGARGGEVGYNLMDVFFTTYEAVEEKDINSIAKNTTAESSFLIEDFRFHDDWVIVDLYKTIGIEIAKECVKAINKSAEKIIDVTEETK